MYYIPTVLPTLLPIIFQTSNLLTILFGVFFYDYIFNLSYHSTTDNLPKVSHEENGKN